MDHNPGDLLAELQRLRSHARSQRRAHWLPLTLFGLLGLFVAPLYVFVPPSTSGAVTSTAVIGGLRLFLLPVGGIITGHPVAIALLWLAGIPLVCAVTALYYRRRGRQVGLRSKIWPFVAVAGVLDAGLVALAQIQRIFVVIPEVAARGLLAYVVVAAGVAVLAWLDRSVGLAVLAFGLVALTAVVNLYNTENVLFRLGLPFNYWTSGLPNPVLPAAYLLAGGLVAHLRTRRA